MTVFFKCSTHFLFVWCFSVGKGVFWLFWEPRLSSGAWAAQLCGSRVFLGSLVPSRCFLGSNGCHWEIFFEPRGSLGSYFEGLGPPGRIWRAVVAKDHAPLSRLPPFFCGFGGKMGAKKLPKRSPNPKISLKNSIKKSIRFWDGFFIGFWLIFEAKIDWILNKNQVAQVYQNKMVESCNVL